ncbi:hypothetical protein CR513_58526, partial [Mucuna pruriens]
MTDAIISRNALTENFLEVAERQVPIVEQQVVAIEMCNEIIREHVTAIKQCTNHVYLKSNMLELLIEMNIMDVCRLQCYEFLCNNDAKKHLLFGIPPHMNCKWVDHPRTNELEMANKKKQVQNTPVEEPLHIPKLLNCNRYFNNDDQMNRYLDDFAARSTVEPKIMDFQFFDSSGFEFQNLLKAQGLDTFVQLYNTYFPDLVKVFYNNLSISGDLCSDVNNIKI